jgi:hypothetical protein
MKRKRGEDPYSYFQRRRKKQRKRGQPYLISGGKSLTGFKPPERKWSSMTEAERHSAALRRQSF